MRTTATNRDDPLDDDIASPAEFLLTNEVARFLKASADSVRKWERLGRLHALKTEQGIRIFHREEVKRFARQREERRRESEPQLHPTAEPRSAA